MSDGINHGQQITYCGTCEYPVRVCRCSDDIASLPLKPCPLCNGPVELVEGFDVDCESTTAKIGCLDCEIEFGPHYSDDKQDVVRFIGRWNNRLAVCK